MTRITSDDGLVSGRPGVVRLYNNAQREQARDEREWVDSLRAHGVTAAHPDDGWVDRRNHRVMLTYPAFDDGLRPGALLALGRPQHFRVVRVTRRELNRFNLEWWHFEPAPEWDPGQPPRSGLGRRLAAQLGAAAKRLVRLVDRR